ncbi:MAG: hypothetical protein ACJA0Y_000884 [Maricaulis maris]|jgi:hypothetical protein
MNSELQSGYGFVLDACRSRCDQDLLATGIAVAIGWETALSGQKFSRRKFPALHTRKLTLIAIFPAEVTMPDWVNNEQGVT